MEWEAKLIEWLQTSLSSAADFSKYFDFFGAETGLLLLVLIVMFCWKKEAGQKLALIVSCVNLWLPMIKSVALRPRPYMEYPDRVKPLALSDESAAAMDVAAQGYSFPSGHSENSMVSFGSIALKTKQKWLKVVLFTIPVLVGISRFVLGVHYPTDVVCGWAVGIVIIIVVPLLRKVIKNDFLFLGLLLLTGIPGFFYCTSDDFYTGYGILLGACVSFIFEERLVKFENTSNVLRAILRTAVGGGIFMLLNVVLKLPFSKEFLASGTFSAHLLRTLRYALNLFIICGLYPMVFKPMDKLWRKKNG